MKRIATLAIVSLLLLCSCGKTEPQKFTAYYFDFFDTATTIVGYAESKEEFDAVCEEICAQFSEYHKLYTIYNRYDGVNNMYAVNRADGPISVDAKIIDMLSFAKEAYYLTDGNTNVAMGSVLSLWHDARSLGEKHPEDAYLPNMEKLVAASKHTDIENLVLDAEHGTVILLDKEMSLDVGAVAKGYATEMVARMLEEKGIHGYLLNVGGNVRATGARPDKTKWTVGIENPNSKGEDDRFLAYLAIANETVVTSGSYQRYYYVDGKAYHHIIDKETLMPSENFRSVSVVCGNSALGDALSTALFCMTYEEGAALVQSLDGVEAMWLLPSGELKYSSGFNKYLK